MGIIKTQHVIHYADLDPIMQDDMHAAAIRNEWRQGESIALGSMMDWRILNSSMLTFFEGECLKAKVDPDDVLFVYDW